MNILLTGFSPFGGEKINPSFEVVKYIKSHYEYPIDVLEVETIYDKCIDQVVHQMDNKNYDYIIMFGQAGGRKAITPERIAINIKDSSILDNNGTTYSNSRISNNGPDGIFTKIDVQRLVKRLNQHDIKAVVSNSAGTYVCNNLYYGILDYIRVNNLVTKALFVHVPYTMNQVENKKDMYGMEFSHMTKGAKLIIDLIISDMKVLI